MRTRTPGSVEEGWTYHRLALIMSVMDANRTRRYDLALAAARKSAGAGWRLLSPALREGLVCRELIGIMASLDAEDTTASRLLADCQAAVTHGDKDCA